VWSWNPWIALREKLGCKTLCKGHYLGAENASDDMDAATFAAINRVVGKAMDMLNADKRKYLYYLIDDPRYAATLAKYGGLSPGDFHLPRLRYVKATPYTDEIVEDTYHRMVRWGLISSAACAANLVDNRCTGETQHWEVHASMHGKATFQEGPATAVAVGHTILRGETTDAHQWLVDVTLVRE
jgi:hypothetical protein